MKGPTVEDLNWFDIAIPLVRRDEGGEQHTQVLNYRIPAVSRDAAQGAAIGIGYAIADGLPYMGDNNAYGWKLADDATATPAN